MTGEGGRGARRRFARNGRRLSVVGVIGELLITAGAVVLLFLGWQFLVNDRVVGGTQQNEARQLSESWNGPESTTPVAPAGRPDPGEPIIAAAPANAEGFATLIVPRFGADYIRPVAEGIGLEDVLNRHGIGHYPGTAMPGGIGNAAFAAHRTGWGSSFFDINTLQVGDAIYLETADGWYRYLTRSLEYVLASGVGVLDPVPQSPGVTATDRLITLTSCNPIYTASERIIVYGVYDTWYPRDGGPPEEIAAIVAQGVS